MRGDLYLAQVIATAAPTAPAVQRDVTLAPSGTRHYVVTGTAAANNIVMPDARRCPIGTRITVENSSPEFVGVRNSNSTLFHRLPPAALATMTLVNRATAPGVWSSRLYDPAVDDPSYGLNRFCDFESYMVSGHYQGTLGFTGVTNGTAASIVTNTGTASPVASGRQGAIHHGTGSTNAGYALSYTTTTNVLSYLGAGCRAFEASIAFPIISEAAEEYVYRIGLGDSIVGTDHAEGCYFKYDRAVLGTTWRFITAKTAGGAGSTTTDTAIAPVIDGTGATWQKLRWEISSNGLRADAWVDNVYIGTQGNLPLTNTGVRIANFGITKTNGGTARFSKIDYVRIQSYPLTRR
jgi:hypothetical protein